MPAIYIPSGKAREYSPYACNLYLGCSHACEYCYTPDALRRGLAELKTRKIVRVTLKESSIILQKISTLNFAYINIFLKIIAHHIGVKVAQSAQKIINIIIV